MVQTRPETAANAYLGTLPEAREYPDAQGRFGRFGGQYAPETLMPALAELEAAYQEARSDPAFLAELAELRRHYVGRPTPTYHAKALSAKLGGAQIWLKREDLAHTGAHKINNALGQGLLAKRMGKPRIIAETGAGQHGVATATVCAMLGLECIVYMGEVDIARQSLNVFRMKLLGATVVPVTSGSRTLKDSLNEAIRDWVTNVRNTYYIIGTVAGMHPYPVMVRDFQAIIGQEARAQMLEQDGRLPDVVVACVGGGSNAMGMFHAFVPDSAVQLIGVEAAGEGIETRQARGEHRRRAHRRPARLTLVCHPGCGRSDHGDALHLGGARLPRRRPGTRLARVDGLRAVCRRDRRGGAGRLATAIPHRRHHPGARIGARHRPCCARSRRRCRKTQSSPSASPAGATKTWARSRMRSG